ncbi:winged helix DNA-binding domain-containing protein, partial [Georgenia sp. 10Sc9-8]|nr:winged helix DNA-binding domain-containing protein [Georgenia halotolerans]
TLAEVSLLRLAAQRLVGPGPGAAEDVVRLLTAVQAQDLPGALTSVALRSGGSPDGAVAALDAGTVVRSWPMRGTLHLVRAEDLGWMLALTGRRMLAAAARRRAELGVDDGVLDRAASSASELLSGGRSAARATLLEHWREAGLLTVPQRGYHLIAHLAQRGLLCFGPVRGGEQHLVLLREWAVRYFRGHGPATRRDFAWWTGLPLADVDVGLAQARAHLAALDVDGTEHLMDPATPDRLAAHRRRARGVVLLPGFDEMVLGYQRREATVPAAVAGRIVPGGNGVFRATVLSGGQVVGTWRRTGRGSRRRVVAEPFTTLTGPVADAVTRAAGRVPDPGVRR